MPEKKEWGTAIACLVAAGVLWLLLRFFSKLSPRLDDLFEWIASNLETAGLKCLVDADRQL
ncbi:MAG: hypothetical protein HC873_19025 [Leptolyngbyaceae cyanobacterium SL_1_1]|nr:hypothetical protein [Leptolyngbyaceae cyanobacterium SL_1_1]